MKIFFLAILMFILTTFAFAQKGEIECVRAEPVPILKKSVFPKKTFKLTVNKENAGEKIGYEKVKLNKDVDLIIINSGCENYTLTFQFSVQNQNRNPNDTKFWYGKVIELMNLVKKGIRSDDISLINRGLKAITFYYNKTRKPRYENYIDFGGKDIRDVVVIKKVTESGLKKIVEITFSVGPL